MRVLLSGGGSGGHVNPAIAIARHIQKRRPSAEILFVGATGCIEEELVPKAGFPIRTLETRGMSRKLSPEGLRQNIRAFRLLRAAMRGADRLIDEFQPDIIIGTGGFASYPPLHRGAKRGIPTLIHESNAFPGKTNKLLGRAVDRILLGFEAGGAYFKQKDKLVFTGNPLRDGMQFEQKEAAKSKLGIQEPLVFSMYGSLGGRYINQTTAEMFALEQADGFPFRHIHSTGKTGYVWMPDYVRAQGVDLAAQNRIDMREYVHDAPTVMTAADLVICRAGAMTMSELCATGTPAVIIPSPYVAENHQHVNARALADKGAAVLLEEKGLTAQTLYDTVKALLADPERLRAMRQAAQNLAVYDAEENIYACMQAVMQEKQAAGMSF